jgi:hypothetical protein
MRWARALCFRREGKLSVQASLQDRLHARGRNKPGLGERVGKPLPASGGIGLGQPENAQTGLSTFFQEPSCELIAKYVIQ